MTDAIEHYKAGVEAVTSKLAMTSPMMHITNWKQAQNKDPCIAICVVWLCEKKRYDLCMKLKRMGTMLERRAFLRVSKSLTLRQGLLYLCVTLISDLESILAFVLPMAYKWAALNCCHQDPGHQGQQWTLSLMYK